MILIFGGAYQGKTAWAKAQFDLRNTDIYACTAEEAPDLSQKCWTNLENFTRFCLARGVDPEEWFRENRPAWEGKVLIFRDIFCGVVPLSGEDRAWREATGRALQYLAGEAGRVSRIFCGLEQRLK